MRARASTGNTVTPAWGLRHRCRDIAALHTEKCRPSRNLHANKRVRFGVAKRGFRRRAEAPSARSQELEQRRTPALESADALEVSKSGPDKMGGRAVWDWAEAAAALGEYLTEGHVVSRAPCRRWAQAGVGPSASSGSLSFGVNPRHRISS